VCEYRDRQGTRFTGLAELTPSMPHAAGDLVEVRYLPSDPEVMREAYYVAVAKEPDSGLVRGAFPWVVNAGVLLYLLRKSRAQLSRAAAIAAYSADPRTRIR